ncbi:glycosyl hydrolase family 16 [Diaporthe helianthi]|uniref:Glycosyl hydrolase family 16 n=1 Tax=Diaporthe helianthi TaxID=158607 RepID=A0A2P5I4P0_DIAHE|nr:glycosyl hydrolase family 16 [Diaporthe helianthi]
MSYSKILVLFSAFQAAHAVVPEVEGFKLTWSDDFVGQANSLPNPANWLISTGTSYPGGASNWGTGEIQTYTSDPANLKISGNGTLQITAIKTGTAWTSARIETQRTDFLAQAGGKMRIQGSLNLPDMGEACVGYWPAFWTLGSDFRGNFQNWPSVGEFDIMENVNCKPSTFGTLHCGTNPGGVCNETTGLSGNITPQNLPQGNFHTYTFELDRTTAGQEAMRWFVDGEQYKEIQQSELPEDVWAEIAHKGHFILMNLAIGGSFPNKDFGADATPLESTKSGGVYQAEYVAVYNTE